ncbi:sensor histidine kinase [Frateuria aurantia]
MAGRSSWLQGLLTPQPGSDAADNIARGVSPWMDLIHLLWSVWIVVVPWLTHGFNRIWLLSTLLSYPLFLIFFVSSLLRPRREVNRLAWACLALALLVAGWNGGAAGTYFMFGCMSLDAEGGRWRGYWAVVIQLLAMIGLFSVVCSVHDYPGALTLWMGGAALLASIITLVMKTSGRKAARLRMSESEVKRLAALAERERIGRDLHDLLGHTLSTITLKLELSRRLAEVDPVRSAHERDEAELVAREALAEVRAAVTGIRAADLAAELAAARLLLAPAGVTLEHDALPTGLAPSIERSLALVVREALTNIARHAAASQAHISFNQDRQLLRVEVSDNGRGIQGPTGHGLAGMRERVVAHGGTLQLDTSSGGGTRVISHWPLGGDVGEAAGRLGAEGRAI